jgi:hypothetical protein
MVGSYEESIIRGRMSTTPSKPLNFVAQIGVLGKGQCKSNLKCPPHVTVPFPAVFYSYNASGGRLSDNSPSPYVGLIDLENCLQHPEEKDTKRKKRHMSPRIDMEERNAEGSIGGADVERHAKLERRKREKMKRRSTSPKAPPGGCYRIPQQGQLQIIIKNPNKTAVKLFLVPYDLSDMEAGQKTFIRQRSYSAGPIIDMPLSSRKNFGTDRPEAALSSSDDPNDRPVLRYLIHLHICCPSKGRFYLYKSVRVVFANRVPDDKEKLRNEIQLPEPRYSAYKPTRDSLANASQANSTAAATLTAEKAFRRKSAGVPSFNRLDHAGEFGRDGTPPFHRPFAQYAGNHGSPMLRPIPFNLTRLDTVESRPNSRDQQSNRMDVDIRSPSRASMSFNFTGIYSTSPEAQDNLSPTDSPSKPGATVKSAHADAYEKLIGRGPAPVDGTVTPTFQRTPFGSFAAPPAIGEGLLAKRLKGLEVERSPTPVGPEDQGSG